MVVRAERQTGSGGQPDHRPDITGLRGLAVVALLLTSAGVGGLPGGVVAVDIFLVVSGFLLTATLLPEWIRTGAVSLPGFYARSARRLLPTAALVLAVSLVLALLLLPEARWAQTGWDLLATGLTGLHWRLAERGVTPVLPDPTAGILAHYWVLGVAGQFILLWPLLFVGVATWAVRRRGLGLRRPLLITLGVLGLASLAWSVQLTTTDPTRAHLAATARFWEFALGGGLALLGARLHRLPGRFAAALGWSGLATVVVAVCTVRPGAHHLGYATLFTALGTAAIIAAGAGRGGPAVLLGRRPLRAVGALAYPLYLWHWPLLVAVRAGFGAGDGGTPDRLHPAVVAGVLGATVGLAVLTHRYVERPVRTGAPASWPAPQVLRIAALIPATAVLGGVLFQLTVWPPAPPEPVPAAAPRPAPATSAASPPAPGAAVLGPSPRNHRRGTPVARVSPIVPAPAEADTDLPDVYRHRCFPAEPASAAQSCVYGDRGSRTTIALAGDTRAASWVPALQEVVQERKWRLITYLNPKCPFLDLAVADPNGQPATACAEWYANVRAKLTGRDRPTLLVTTNLRHTPVDRGRTLTGKRADEALSAAMRRTWSGLADAGLRTVVLRDTPVMTFVGAACAAEHSQRLTRCTRDRKPALAAGVGAIQAEAARKLDGVTLVDLNDAICPADKCAAVIGNVLVYRDSHHLTATYARTLGPRLGARLDRVLR